MVEVMKITVTSFKRSHACTATFSAPNPAARHCWTTSGRVSWTLTAGLGQSLVQSLLLSPRSWCAWDPVCAHQESVSPVLCKQTLNYQQVRDCLFCSNTINLRFPITKVRWRREKTYTDILKSYLSSVKYLGASIPLLIQIYSHSLSLLHTWAHRHTQTHTHTHTHTHFHKVLKRNM